MSQTSLQIKIRTVGRFSDPGAALRQRRHWFAEGDDAGAAGNKTPDKPAGEGQAKPAPDGALNTDPGKNETTVPYERFSEMVSAKKVLENELAEIKKAQEATRQAELARQTEEAKKRGEFEQLYQAEAEKVKTLTTERDELIRYRTMFEEDVKKRREGLPEHIQELMNGMTPLQQAEYLVKHGDKLKANQAPGLDGGERGSGTGKGGVVLSPVRL